MKTKIYSLLAASMMVVTLTGCDDWSPAEQSAAGVATVSAARMDVHVNEAPTATSRASVDFSGFQVTITDRNGQTVNYNDKPCSWTYAAMPQVFTLPVGEYTVHVASHTPEPAAFDAPYYVGSEDFTVNNNAVTYIGTVNCHFASLKVGLNFSKTMLNLLGDDARVSVKAGLADAELIWTKDDASRDGYFYVTDDNPTVLATFSANIQGEDIYLTKDITDAKAGNYYIFNFSLNTGTPDDEFGGFDANLENPVHGVYMDYEVIENRVDETITPDLKPTVDPEDHPDKEEWPDPVGPDVPGPDEPGGDDPVVDDEAIKLSYDGINPDAINPIDRDKYVVKVETTEPINKLEVKIVSDYLTAEFLEGVDLAAEFDLVAPVAPDGRDLTEAINGLGLPTGDAVKGMTSLSFELTKLIPLLSVSMGAEPGQIHTFRLTVATGEGDAVEEKIQDLKFQTPY